MSSESLPDYQIPVFDERGSRLSVTFQDYRELAGAALAITESVSSFMGIYRLAGHTGCGLDIWTKDCCLTITVDSSERQLCLLLLPDLDSVEQHCLLIASNSPSDWRQLAQLAREEIIKRNGSDG
jgi:hypothetical protein